VRLQTQRFACRCGEHGVKQICQFSARSMAGAVRAARGNSLSLSLYCWWPGGFKEAASCLESRFLTFPYINSSLPKFS
jgi:hypothetical protein